MATKKTFENISSEDVVYINDKGKFDVYINKISSCQCCSLDYCEKHCRYYHCDTVALANDLIFEEEIKIDERWKELTYGKSLYGGWYAHTGNFRKNFHADTLKAIKEWATENDLVLWYRFDY